MGHEDEQGVGLRAQEQARFNRERFEELRSLTREDSWTHIKTRTHLTIIRQVLCAPNEVEACLEFDIKKGGWTYSYHVDHRGSIPKWGIEADIKAEDHKIPGGGAVSVSTISDTRDGLDFPRLSDFVLHQAEIGKTRYVEPILSEPVVDAPSRYIPYRKNGNGYRSR